MKTRDKVRKLDAGLRHKSGTQQHDFVKHYTKVFSKFAYATRDESWNEFEKEITHVLGMYMYTRKFCEILGFSDGEDGFDPRDFVNDYEDALEKKEGETNSAARELMHSVLMEVTDKNHKKDS